MGQKSKTARSMGRTADEERQTVLETLAARVLDQRTGDRKQSRGEQTLEADRTEERLQRRRQPEGHWLRVTKVGPSCRQRREHVARVLFGIRTALSPTSPRTTAPELRLKWIRAGDRPPMQNA